MDINEAINGVRAMARQADALAKIVTVLDNIDNLQATADAAQATCDRMKSEMATAQTDLWAAKSEAEQIRFNAQALFQKTTDDANELLAYAQHQSGQALAAARAQADEITNAAAQQAAATRAAAQADLDAMNLSRIDAQRELDSINEKLAQVRATAQQLLGG